MGARLASKVDIRELLSLSPINFLFRLSFHYSFVLIGQIESL